MHANIIHYVVMSIISCSMDKQMMIYKKIYKFWIDCLKCLLHKS